ncbi:LPS export ABC transporter permease LptF [Bathymodiolus septemdierum thioautotrophic gill symbiont]|uniref:LPS export ABC transporter permease LptF n=1 Tax=Bathymodiolus septemdierum thioautotrophic gill symbiont TaxID=113267 RepID=UPI0008267759|nr:LPS export ABC transporter permease LptF [Bathymodiolus septemdierum thioautotrophic gill symbiont]
MKILKSISTFQQAYYLINTIIAKYVMRNVWVLLGAIFLIISLVIFGNQVVLMLKESLKYGIATADLFPLIAFNMIRDIPLILSLSLFLAIILAISKLYKDSEAIIMNSFGVGDKHFMLFIQPVVLSAFTFILLLTTLVVPWTKEQKSLITHRNANISGFAFIKQKEFQKFKGDDIIFYANKVEEGDGKIQQTMKDVFIYTLINDKPIITLAKEAQKYTNLNTQSVYLHLKEGTRYHGFPDDLNKRILNFDLYDLQIVDGEKQNNTPKFTRVESQSTMDLLFSSKPKDAAEFQWRISQALSVFILSFLGVLLGKASPRGGKNLGLLFGIAIFILYNNALMVAKSTLERGEVAAWIGLWWVHFLMFVIIILLYGYRHEKFRTVSRFFLKRVK